MKPLEQILDMVVRNSSSAEVVLLSRLLACPSGVRGAGFEGPDVSAACRPPGPSCVADCAEAGVYIEDNKISAAAGVIGHVMKWVFT